MKGPRRREGQIEIEYNTIRCEVRDKHEDVCQNGICKDLEYKPHLDIWNQEFRDTYRSCLLHKVEIAYTIVQFADTNSSRALVKHWRANREIPC